MGLSFVLLGMALIWGKLVPWLAAVYVPTSGLAGFLMLCAMIGNHRDVRRGGHGTVAGMGGLRDDAVPAKRRTAQRR